MGMLLAMLDEESREERAQTQEEQRVELAKAELSLAELEKLLSETERSARLLIAEAMVAAGYHRPKRWKWRRKRDG